MPTTPWYPREAWRRYRLELEAARNYPISYSLYIGQSHRDRLLEELLPTLLYIKAVALLDDSLDVWLSGNGHTLTKPHREDLNGRLMYLNDRNFLKDVGDLHAIRKQRNDLAHTPGASTDWKALEKDVVRIERSLLELALVRSTPKLEYFAERSAMRESDDPNVEFSRQFTYGVKEHGKPALEITFTQNFLRS